MLQLIATTTKILRQLPKHFGSAARSACAVLTCLLILSGCNPIYVMQAAWQQSKILMSREDIEQILNDPRFTNGQRQKLSLVLAAREYAKQIGLNPGNSFTTYAEVPGDSVTWIVAAARPTSFQLYQWWFPIIGDVPYKGYFSKEAALSEARDLEAQGYETYVRGAQAFSTLGWFSDPLLSTTLKNQPPTLVNTVIHESLHNTLWINNQVAFNESLAHFVGSQGSLEFFAEQISRLDNSETQQLEVMQTYLDQARRSLERDTLLAEALETIFTQLEGLYRGADNETEILKKREIIVASNLAPFRLQFPEASLLSKANNAEILSLRVYLTDFPLFRELFSICDFDFQAFLSEVLKIKSELDAKPHSDPFELLKQRVITRRLK